MSGEAPKWTPEMSWQELLDTFPEDFASDHPFEDVVKVKVRAKQNLGELAARDVLAKMWPVLGPRGLAKGCKR